MKEGNRELSIIQFHMTKKYLSNIWIYIKKSQSKKKIQLFKSWGCSSVVEHLTSVYKVLGLNRSTVRNNQGQIKTMNCIAKNNIWKRSKIRLKHISSQYETV